ncbi:MAG: site-specific integrase [Lachnospiraceae bacterium]|nr:site-specific integrase [Lachnospiraceae bacterium]
MQQVLAAPVRDKSADTGKKGATVNRSLDHFLASIYLPQARHRKRSWHVDERIARQYLSPAFGGHTLSRITRPAVENWLAGLSASGLKAATCNRILAVFKSVCAQAVAWGWLPQSPCQGVRSLRLPAAPVRSLNAEEARRVLRALEDCPAQEALALRLLLLTGGRKSEILRARWEDVRPEARVLIVPLAKSGAARHITLSDAALAVLAVIPRGGSPWLFPAQRGDKPLADIYRFWNDLRQRLRLGQVRVHDLRHTFASLLVNSGHSLYEVQHLLGHADPRTTMRYAHLGQGTLVRAGNAVGELLGADARC